MILSILSACAQCFHNFRGKGDFFAAASYDGTMDELMKTFEGGQEDGADEEPADVVGK